MANNAAFEVLYREFHGRVYGLCRRMLGSATLAEDATQESFTRAFRNFRRYDPARPFWQWIATVASHTCIDLLRRQRRADWVDIDGADLDAAAREAIEATATPGPEAGVIARQDAGALHAAIAALPDRYRVPLVLAYFSDASYDDIAAALGTTRNHVGVLLVRAKQHLRAHLPDRAEGGPP